ncbi:hypothetical protein HMPREF0262_02000 [Clostridium sp. ATCC 29733]|nr:hypothetical protein HMPREF0262_02000 [Clostridium sp. ATCC 29733]
MAASSFLGSRPALQPLLRDRPAFFFGPCLGGISPPFNIWKGGRGNSYIFLKSALKTRQIPRRCGVRNWGVLSNFRPFRQERLTAGQQRSMIDGVIQSKLCKLGHLYKIFGRGEGWR